MASHSSTLAWKIPWTEEPGKLQSMGSLYLLSEKLNEHNLEIHQNDKTERLQGRKRSPDCTALDLFESLTNALRTVVLLFSSILVEMI